MGGRLQEIGLPPYPTIFRPFRAIKMRQSSMVNGQNDNREQSPHHVKKEASTDCWRFFVGISGLEPKITGPESVVLPITPYPNLMSQAKNMPYLSFAAAKLQKFFDIQAMKCFFFSKKRWNLLFILLIIVVCSLHIRFHSVTTHRSSSECINLFGLFKFHADKLRK